MRKFKEGDWLVRNANFTRNFPEGWESRVLEDFCVADLDGQLIPINYHYWKLAEDTSKPVTVTHEGNVYELDKHYLFGNSHQLHRLLKIDKSSVFPFRVLDKGQENGFTKIHLVDLDTGTITPALIELIDGNSYMFDESGYQKKDCVGLYEKFRHKFHLTNYAVFVNDCTNIRPMTVTESK
jgi:hypothetical protein